MARGCRWSVRREDLLPVISDKDLDVSSVLHTQSNDPFLPTVFAASVAVQAATSCLRGRIAIAERVIPTVRCKAVDVRAINTCVSELKKASPEHSEPGRTGECQEGAGGSNLDSTCHPRACLVLVTRKPHTHTPSPVDSLISRDTSICI